MNASFSFYAVADANAVGTELCNPIPVSATVFAVVAIDDTRISVISGM